MALPTEAHVRLTSLSAFLIPALALWLPSGYAWGTGVLLLGALLATSTWISKPVQPSSAQWLALAFGLMALAWLHGSDWSRGLSVLNKPSRYLFALPCLFYALRFPPRPDALLAGIAVGAAGGGLRALYDVAALGLERPWTNLHDSSNAIQLGNLCGLFGLMCWLQVLVYWERWRWARRAAVLLCGVLGLTGSLLSQTRGGWLALMLCAPLLLWLLARQLSWRRAGGGALLLAAMLLPLGWHLSGTLEQRLHWAIDETLGYQRSSEADSSVGHRLDHWQLAWRMGTNRPLGGWGEAGYRAEKARLVAAGEAQPAVLGYGHAHNELLDQFAKRGLIGVGGLLMLYGVPLVLFWPRRPRSHRGDPALLDRVCLRLMGVSVPLAFMGFGLTQVFFAHYNGVVIYLALVVLLFSALHGLAGQRIIDAYAGSQAHSGDDAAPRAGAAALDGDTTERLTPTASAQ